MTFKSIPLRLLNIKGAKVDGIDFEDDAAMTVHVHLVRREQWRCPVCGKRCGVYDHATAESFWRSMDFGPVPVRIDETSYRKGHSYITVVVNHDTNTVVWAHDGHGKEIIEMFFGELTEEQRASIRLVSGDGARWITDAMLNRMLDDLTRLFAEQALKL